MADSFRDALAEVICSRQQQLAIGIGIFSVLIVMMAVSRQVSEQGSATYVIATFNLYSLVGLIGVCGMLILWCRHGQS